MRIYIVLICALLCPSLAGADGMTAKEHYKKGISYYALQKFAEAALEYEAAFEMQPDPALLYNAAQAHRLAGNKQRAVALYMSFLRMFPGKDDGTVQKHIAALRAAIEAEGKAQQNPPTAPKSVDVKAEEPKPSQAPTTTAPAVVVQQPPPPPPKKSTPKWVWGVVGGVVAAVGIGLGVGLGVGLSGNSYPSATYSGRVP
jgi:tetratricopeptide (TPR) repeat protein